MAAGQAGTAGRQEDPGTSGAAGSPSAPMASGVLCVFDYDLTISTHACPAAQASCRKNACQTYNWYEQCISDGAKRAVAKCVERGAFIGIASHASVDACWQDKVLPITQQMQLPELTSAQRYVAPGADFSYPRLDERTNWNCDDCAYHMNSAFSKPQLIAKIMRHYGLDPNDAAARAHVILWDDTLENIQATQHDMPEVTAIRVHQNVDGDPNSGGCGIVDADIASGWAPLGL